MRRLRALIAPAAVLLILAGCGVHGAETPAQRLYALQADFNLMQRAVLAYTERPDCTPPGIVVACARPPVRDRLRQAAAEALTALRTARTSLGRGDGAAGAALPLAAAALRRLAAEMAAGEVRS